MNCYHCKAELSKGDTGHFHCPDCIKKYDLMDVIMCNENDHSNIPLYFHIYVASPDYKVVTIPSPRPPMISAMHFEVGRKYHVRLHLQENYTAIASPCGDNYNHIVDVPGFPITPENVRRKLPTYILFS